MSFLSVILINVFLSLPSLCLPLYVFPPPHPSTSCLSSLPITPTVSCPLVAVPKTELPPWQFCDICSKTEVECKAKCSVSDKEKVRTSGEREGRSREREFSDDEFSDRYESLDSTEPNACSRIVPTSVLSSASALLASLFLLFFARCFAYA